MFYLFHVFNLRCCWIKLLLDTVVTKMISSNYQKCLSSFKLHHQASFHAVISPALYNEKASGGGGGSLEAATASRKALKVHLYDFVL